MCHKAEKLLIGVDFTGKVRDCVLIKQRTRVDMLGYCNSQFILYELVKTSDEFVY